MLVVDAQDQVPGGEGRADSAAMEALGVDYVIESTGLFTDAEKAKGHIAAR